MKKTQKTKRKWLPTLMSKIAGITILGMVLLVVVCEGSGKMNQNNPIDGPKEIRLEQLEGNNAFITVKQETELSYTYRLWGSVGYTADYQINKPEIIKLLDHKVSYLHPQIPGMCGGDEAKAKFIFQCQKSGTALLIIREKFRGEVETEKQYQIKIE